MPSNATKLHRSPRVEDAAAQAAVGLPEAVQPATDLAPASRVEEPASLVEVEILVEEISIDGMCGVY